LIKSWLQTYPDDFKDDNEMIRKIKDFLKSANERPELKVLIHQVTSKALSVLETIVDKFIFDMQQQAFHRTPQAEMALSTPEWNLSMFNFIMIHHKTLDKFHIACRRDLLIMRLL
jgi:hypothetical protein